VEAAPIVERYRLLEAGYAEAIAAAVLAGLTDEDVGAAVAQSVPEPVSSSGQLPVDIPLEPESDTVPDATVEVLPAAQMSWLEDDLFAA
jgi:exonuclease SbcD